MLKRKHYYRSRYFVINRRNKFGVSSFETVETSDVGKTIESTPKAAEIPSNYCYTEGALWYIDIPLTQPTEHISFAQNSDINLTPKQLFASLFVFATSSESNRLTFSDVKTFSNLNNYLVHVPHCSLTDPKKLEQEEISSLWGPIGRLRHLQLGHPNVNLLHTLAELFPELYRISIPSFIEDCYPCKVVKATKLPHKSTRCRATRFLKLLHTDVMGEVLPPGFPTNCHWCLAIIDDFTQYAFVYP